VKQSKKGSDNDLQSPQLKVMLSVSADAAATGGRRALAADDRSAVGFRAFSNIHASIHGNVLLNS
jgi:hypothetical protein